MAQKRRAQTLFTAKMSGNEVSTLIFVHIEDIKIDTNTNSMSKNMSVSLFHLLFRTNFINQKSRKKQQKAAKTTISAAKES